MSNLITLEQKTSFLQVMDLGLKTLVFNQFKPVMSLTDIETDIAFVPKGVAQRIIAEKRGEGTVEFINLYRTETKFSWDRHRTSVGRNGLYIEFALPNKSSVVNLKAVPTDLEYTIWFWSKDNEKVQRAIEEYMFWIHQEPRLKLRLAERYPLEIYMKFGSVSDESTVETEFDTGRYFVASVPISLEGWVFKILKEKTILRIHVEIYLKTEEGESPIFLTDWWLP